MTAPSTGLVRATVGGFTGGGGGGGGLSGTERVRSSIANGAGLPSSWPVSNRPAPSVRRTDRIRADASATDIGATTEPGNVTDPNAETSTSRLSATTAPEASKANSRAQTSQKFASGKQNSEPAFGAPTDIETRSRPCGKLIDSRFAPLLHATSPQVA